MVNHGTDASTVMGGGTEISPVEEVEVHRHDGLQVSSNSRSDEHQNANPSRKQCFTLFNYSPLTTAIMVSMVVAGAGRSVAVKAYFQLGFESPLLVTMLYLLGSFLCIVPYYVAVIMDKYLKYRANKRGKDDTCSSIQHGAVTNNDNACTNEEEKEPIECSEDDDDDRGGIKSSRHEDIRYVASSTAGSHLSLISLALSNRSSRFSDISVPLDDPKGIESQRVVSSVSGVLVDSEHHNWTEGSRTGLTRESEKRVAQWVNRIPPWLAPVLPGLCNVIKSFLRWAALIYVSASVAEILIGGLELVFIVFAARLVRKRRVSKLRWLGVIIVCVGIVIVGCTDVLGSKKDKSKEEGESNSKGAANQLIGIALIVGQCLVSVVQDILEEVFMQVGDFPALLLVGVEGFVGIVVGLALYYPAAQVLNENPLETWNNLTSSAGKVGFVVGLTLLFMVSAVFNILACAATSSMTRNMWGNLRTILVWILGLIIYYSSAGDNDIGEPWRIPESFIILAGFGVILYGLQMYYKEKSTVQRNKHS